MDQYSISKVILSNSGTVEKAILNEFSNNKYFVHLNAETKIPILNKYGSPQTLGKDRLAAAIGSILYFPEGNSLIIDMGTCITTDFLNGKLEYLGGNISPGIKMKLIAMHKFTASLPLVEPFNNEITFAANTENALQNGAVKGTIHELNSFIKEVREKYGPINVILTGGEAIFFEKYAKNKIFVAPNLVLEGLNEILRYNEY